MKKRTIALLKKEGIDEALILSLKPHHSMSPCMIEPGDEPVEVLAAGSGLYYIRTDDGFLMDMDQHYTVPADKVEAGRVRYLHHFGEQERARMVRLEMEKRRQRAEKRLAEIKAYVRGFRVILGLVEPTTLEDLTWMTPWTRDRTEAMLLLGDTGYKDGKIRAATDFLNHHPDIDQHIESVQILLDSGDTYGALVALGLERPENPIMTARHDDPVGMMHLKNALGRKAVDAAYTEDGGGHEQVLAGVEVEKRYS
jgi:hypothetical protein